MYMGRLINHFGGFPSYHDCDAIPDDTLHTVAAGGNIFMLHDGKIFASFG